MTIKAIVTDIEGTTTDIAFVHNVLFPYSRQRMADFVHQRYNEAEVQPHIAAVADLQSIAEDDLEGITNALLHWIDTDQKVGPLKAIQGMQWAEGFRAGDFKGHLYPDAHKQLSRWAEQGMPMYVYSSGSVQAQKLLYGYSEFGDLTPLFRGHFDTVVGGKKEMASYVTIAEKIGLPGEQLLFLSDIREELDAARAGGWHTAWLVRDQATVDTQAPHRQFLNFDGLAAYVDELNA